MHALLTDGETEVELPETESWTAERVIDWTVNRFAHRAALCTSFQVDGMVILDIAARMGLDLRVFTIDTGRLHPETYELIDRVREHYGIQVETSFPDQKELNEFTTTSGVNPFYRSIESRIRCCEIRKSGPLNGMLRGLDAWITGVRRQQSQTRTTVDKLEIDAIHGGIVKANPLADWDDARVWDYARENDVPYNALYDQGYTSIGCAPCTRPLKPGEGARDGRWWWERDTPKECTIHFGPEVLRTGKG